MKIKLLLFGLLFAMAQFAIAQTHNASGVVRDANGEPVMGASVTVKGTNTRTATDANGKFTLRNLKAGDVLVVSYIGAQTQEVKSGKNLLISLKDSSTDLDEAVVVAFGKQKKAAFTGSAGIVGAESLEKRQVTNALSALNGEVSGVQITDNSGDPASEPTIRIRGFSSINAGNDPLIILDGAPYDGGINNINPSDIESVTVQKDAASNALYGARGANGVIMITTKSAKKGEGKTTVSLDAKWGANSNAARDYDVVDNAGEYYEMFYRAMRNYYINAGNSAYDAHTMANERIALPASQGGLGYVVYKVPTGEYLIGENGKLNPHATLGRQVTNNGVTYTILPDDWKDEAYRVALRQEYNLSVSSSTDKAQVYASIGYLNNEGIVYNSAYERYTARLKADWQAKSWLSLGANGSFSHSERRYVESESSTSLFYTLQSMAPIYPAFIRDADGNIMTDANGRMYDYGEGDVIGLIRPVLSQYNLLQENSLNTNKTVYNNFTLNGYVDIMPIDGLKVTVNGTITNHQSRGTYTYNPYYGFSATTYTNGAVSKDQSQTYSYNLQQLINYTRTFGLHTMSLLAGHESYKYRYDYLTGSKQNMASYFSNQNLAGAITVLDADDNVTDYNNEGWFFRGQYEYDGRIFASASFRRDASSRFHPDNRWGNFYSLGAAWVISKESWFNAPWVDNLKVKASIGQQGNDNIGDFRYTDLYQLVSNNGQAGLVYYSKGNKDITWETNTNFNLGVEFSLFKGRLSGGIDFFHRHTTDMLCFIKAPRSAGYTGQYNNVGDMNNTGVEIDLNAVIIRNAILTWSVNLNATHYKNEVTKLADELKTVSMEGHGGYVSSGNDQFTGEGLSLFTWYLKKYAGVSSDGRSMWYTKNGGTTTQYTEADYFLCGDATPDLYGGFGTKLSAYGFDLSVSFNYSLGGKAYDYNYATLMSSPYGTTTGLNFHRDLYNAWSETNTSSDIPRFVYGDQYSSAMSSRFLTSASYLSLQNINIGYTVPSRLVKKLGLSSVRIYGSADNICYWSKRQGFDPRGTFDGETSTYTYSPMKSISGGINVTF